jgi:hypothetical protein
MVADSLEVIRSRINSGDREGARLALLEVLEAAPDTTEAWALLAILLEEPSKQLECYRQILRIDPENRQAAMWLKALSQQIPDPAARSVYARSVDSVLMELRGTPPSVAGPDLESGKVDRVPEESELADLDAEARRLLRGLGLATEPLKQGFSSPEAQAEDKGFLDRMVSLLTGSPLDSRALSGSVGRMSAAQKPRQLSPDEIIELAGGPLSPEERRNCPKCGAVISRSENKCPWCSEPLSAGEAG